MVDDEWEDISIKKAKEIIEKGILTDEEQENISYEEQKEFQDEYWGHVEEPKEFTNFIDDLKEALYVACPLLHPDVAYACASNIFSSCLPYVRVLSSMGPLNLSEMDMIIGRSGIGKTKPFSYIRTMSQNLGNTLAGRYTFEGIAAHFAEKDTRLDEDEELELDDRAIQRNEHRRQQLRYSTDPNIPFANDPYGLIILDEISGFISESQAKKYMAGSLEALSKFYDGRIEETKLKETFIKPQEPLYINVLGATVPSTLEKIGDFLFSQGLAGRFNWVYVEPLDNPPLKSISNHKVYDEAKSKLEKFEKQLKALIELNKQEYQNLIEDNDKIEEEKDKKAKEDLYIGIEIERNANVIWMQYYKDAYSMWKNEIDSFPNETKKDFMARLAELVLKQAGRNAIARDFKLSGCLEEESILPFDLKKVSINAEDMEQAIKRMQVSRLAIMKVIQYRTIAIATTKGTLLDLYSVNNLVNCLVGAPHMMLNTKQLKEASKISDETTFTKYLRKGTEDMHRILEVDKSSIKDEKEKERLKTNTKARVWTPNPKYLNK